MNTRILLQADKEPKLHRDTIRAGEKLRFTRLEDHLKNMGILAGTGGEGGTGGGDGEDDDEVVDPGF
ncbi:hypothetical protein [Bacteroides sp. 51]|uniref:hypothetical protein n=1 Tax=Bacteroides sp. 51 TaxID=2302938 RepID=UPI0013D50A47|nr:hypothetical protein [Bacteroides sp. 51]